MIRLDEAIRRLRRRRQQGERERSVGQYLALAGAIGWLVVIPALAGAALGQYLDRRLGTGVLLSGALLVVGLALGCYGAWRTLRREGGEP